MTPMDPIKLAVIRGENRIFESEGFYDVRPFSKDGGAAATIRDIVTDEVLFDGIQIESITLSAPFVYIRTKKV